MPKTPYEKWQDTVNQGITDPAWDRYDPTIRILVSSMRAWAENPAMWRSPCLR